MWTRLTVDAASGRNLQSPPEFHLRSRSTAEVTARLAGALLSMCIGNSVAIDRGNLSPRAGTLASMSAS